MTLIPELEQQLIALADRSAPRQRGGWLRPRASIVMLAISVALTAGIAVAALSLLGHVERRAPATMQLTPQQAKLVNVLAVMREAQTPAAAAFKHAGWPTPPSTHTTLDRSLTRLATTTSWGARVFLVAINPPRNRAQATALGEVAALWVQGIGWSDYATVTAITTGNAWGPGHTATTAAGTRVYRFFEIVPDGVSRVVSYTLRRTPRPGTPPRFSGQTTAIVHGNVAVFQTREGPSVVYAAWYAANGHLIKRIGDWTATP